MRCFISINFQERTKKRIIEIQNKLPNFFGKKIKNQNLHLTLKFLGEVNKEKIKEVIRRLNKIKFNRLNAKIDSVGVFSEKSIRIIWLHVNGFYELQKIIDDSLKDLFEKENRFMSHLTIARVKNVKNKKLFLYKLNEMNIPNLEFKVNKFYLMSSKLSSRGPKYSIIKIFKSHT